MKQPGFRSIAVIVLHVHVYEYRPKIPKNRPTVKCITMHKTNQLRPLYHHDPGCGFSHSICGEERSWYVLLEDSRHGDGRRRLLSSVVAISGDISLALKQEPVLRFFNNELPLLIAGGLKAWADSYLIRSFFSLFLYVRTWKIEKKLALLFYSDFLHFGSQKI